MVKNIITSNSFIIKGDIIKYQGLKKFNIVIEKVSYSNNYEYTLKPLSKWKLIRFIQVFYYKTFIIKNK